MPNRFCMWTALLTVLAIPTFARAEVSSEEIKSLVRQLVSPNQPPVIKEGRAKFPASYDKNAQSHVGTAWRRLYDIGHAAFPHLLEQLADKQYCFTRRDPLEGDSDNYSVGEACLVIIRSHLQPYGARYTEGDGDPRSRARRPSYVNKHLLSDTKAARVWWEAHREKSMRELQIEALEWVIEQEAKRSKDYPQEERKYLRKTLKRLRKSAESLEPSWPFDK